MTSLSHFVTYETKSQLRNIYESFKFPAISNWTFRPQGARYKYQIKQSTILSIFDDVNIIFFSWWCRTNVCFQLYAFFFIVTWGKFLTYQSRHFLFLQWMIIKFHKFTESPILFCIWCALIVWHNFLDIVEYLQLQIYTEFVS